MMSSGEQQSGAAGKMADLPSELESQPHITAAGRDQNTAVVFLGDTSQAFHSPGQNCPSMLCCPPGLSAGTLSPLEAAGLWSSVHKSIQSPWERQDRLGVSPHSFLCTRHSPNDSAHLLCAQGSYTLDVRQQTEPQ